MHTVPDADKEIASDREGRTPESVYLFAATPAQRRFWLLDQLLPNGNPALNMPIGLRWRGPLEVSLLRRALNQVIARHEALRTTFETDRRQLQQIIVPTLTIDLDTSQVPRPAGSNLNDFIADLMRVEARRSFDLRAGPLVRARLTPLEQDDHLILITVHHIVSDGWSNRIFVHDLFAGYERLASGSSITLPELSIQFADYADWLATRIASDDFASQRTYWRTKLSGDFPVLALPIDRIQRGGPGAAAETRSLLLPSTLVRAAKSLGAAEGASPFMVFLAVFQMLVHRYSGQNDFLLTSPCANRDRPEFESVIGPFANALILRADLHGDPTFRQLLDRVRCVALEAFSNQDIPFESLLDEFQACRLQANFHYSTKWEPPAQLPDGATVELLPAVSTGTVYDLSASAFEEGESVRFEVEYKTALFDAHTIERILNDYQTLLETAIREPDKRISNLELAIADSPRATVGATGQATDTHTRLPTDKPAVTTTPVRPYLGLQLQLIAIWEDVLGVRGVGIRDDFFDLGGNSLLAIRMLQRAEAACGKMISPAALFRHPTIEHLAGEMAREAIDESPTLLRVNDSGTRVPFFYLHGDLSGGGFYSMKLSRALGPNQPFYVMPPHDIRNLPAAPTIEEMAAAHLEVLRSVRSKGPYVIGGFCIGGLVAYELAQQLRARGDEVQMLLIIDAAPERKVLRALRALAALAGSLLGWNDETKVRQFGRWAIWRSRLADGVGAGGGPRTHSVQGRIYRRLTNVWNILGNRLASSRKVETQKGRDGSPLKERDLPSAFQWASAVYRPKSYDGPVALLLSQDVIGMAENPSREWRELAPKTTVHSLPGSHLECITEHVETLAREIQTCLQDVAARGEHGKAGHS